jgi:hypothetical protein
LKPIARGWRRFRRLPGILQATAWIAIVAVYSVGLVLVLSGGDDEPTVRGKRPLTSLERKVFDALQGVKAGRPAAEPTDNSRFRAATIRRVVCTETACRIDYSVGLPGRGRILEDQRPMIRRLFADTAIVRAEFNVVRDIAAAGVPAKQGEEAANGMPLLTTRCDRSGAPDVDWQSARGAQILHNVCEVEGYARGGVTDRQEPVAPDDPAAKDLDLPEGSG